MQKMKTLVPIWITFTLAALVFQNCSKLSASAPPITSAASQSAEPPAPGPTPATGQVYLSFKSVNQISLCPKNGSSMVIGGVAYTVPVSCVSAGISGVYVGGVAGQSLSANTVYDVFLFYVGGQLALDFYQTTSGVHMQDTSPGNIGIEVRNNNGTPDPTHSYVGKVATNSSDQFATATFGAANAGQGVGVISWFNRVPLQVGGNLNIGGTYKAPTNNDFGEIDKDLRIYFLTFGDSAVESSGNAFIQQTTANNDAFFQSFIDTTIHDPDHGSNGGFDNSIAGYMPIGRTFWRGTPSEGRHYFSLYLTATGSLTIGGIDHHVMLQD